MALLFCLSFFISCDSLAVFLFHLIPSFNWSDCISWSFFFFCMSVCMCVQLFMSQQCNIYNFHFSNTVLFLYVTPWLISSKRMQQDAIHTYSTPLPDFVHFLSRLYSLHPHSYHPLISPLYLYLYMFFSFSNRRIRRHLHVSIFPISRQSKSE